MLLSSYVNIQGRGDRDEFGSWVVGLVWVWVFYDFVYSLNVCFFRVYF